MSRKTQPHNLVHERVRNMGSMLGPLSLTPIFLARAAAAFSLNLDDASSIRDAAATIAWGMMTWYSGNETDGTPGLLPRPANSVYADGMMWSTSVDYWYYTGDTTYNNVTA
jgi:mannan endo-1,6-alpha-mannosidase